MNILITSAGRRNYLVKYFKEALGDKGKVFASNSNIYSSALAFADESFVLPEIIDPKYIQALLNLCIKKKVELIVPVFDLDLVILSKNKELFKKNGITIAVSDPDIIEICFDKYKTFTFLSENGLSHPKTYLNIEQCINDLQKKIINFPLVIKPRWGTGSIGIYYTNTINELTFFYQYCLKTIKNTYIPNNDINSIIIQEKINGQEFGLDVINNFQSKFETCFVKKKIAMRSGETDTAITESNKKLFTLGEKLSFLLKHTGNLDVDLFYSHDNYWILELNPRFGGGYPFSHIAGANIPAAYIAWTLGDKTNTDWFNIKYNIIATKGVEIFRIIYDKS